METAGQPTEDAAAALAKWRTEQDDFIKQTGLKRQYAREEVSGFERSEATKADLHDRQLYSRKFSEKELNISPNDVAKHRQLMYTNPPEYEQQQKYLHSVNSGMLSPLSGYNLYKEYHGRIQDEIINSFTPNGIRITEQSNHFLERVIGTTYDPGTKKPRSVVSLDTVKETLSTGVVNPSKEKDGRISQAFVGKECIVTVNPDTGQLIQCKLK